jgi:hypothetical protein
MKEGGQRAEPKHTVGSAQQSQPFPTQLTISSLALARRPTRTTLAAREDVPTRKISSRPRVDAQAEV